MSEQENEQSGRTDTGRLAIGRNDWLLAFKSAGKSDGMSNKVSDESERYIGPEKIEQ